MFTANCYRQSISFENLADLENWVIDTMAATTPGGFGVRRLDFGNSNDLAVLVAVIAMHGCERGIATQLPRAVNLATHGRLLMVTGPDGGQSIFGGMDHRANICYLLEAWGLAETAPEILEDGRPMDFSDAVMSVDILVELCREVLAA